MIPKLVFFMSKMEKGKYYNLAKSQTIATLHFFMTYINEMIMYGVRGTLENISGTPLYVIGKVMVYILLSVVWYKIITMDLSNKETEKKIIFFSLYFGLMMLLLVLVWPGIWHYDEIGVLNYLSSGGTHFWQHWLTSLYHFVCLEIMPSPAGILIIQVFTISLIVTYIVWISYHNLKTKFVFLLYLPLLSLAVLEDNLYPIRSTLCAYLELLLVFSMIDLAFFEKEYSVLKFMELAIIGGLLAAWRPENIVYILGVPIILVIVKKVTLKKIGIYFFVSILLFCAITKYQNYGLSQSVFSIDEKGRTTWAKEAYAMSGFMGSLGAIVLTDFKSNDKEADLSLINESIDLEMLKNIGGEGAFWNGGLKEVTPEKLSQLEKLYLKLVLYNFPTFFKSRWNNFVPKNCTSPQRLFYSASAHIFDDFNEEESKMFFAGIYQEFREAGYIYNKPLSVELRKKIISILECKNLDDYEISSRRSVVIFYNVIPIIIILIVIWLYETLKKRWFYFCVIGLFLAKFGIIFLTAPGYNFMYYFSTYLVGSILIVFWFVSKINLLKNKKFRRI